MSAKYPTSAATDTDLNIAVNDMATQLNGAINDTDTNITVNSSILFPPTGYISVDFEVIHYSAKPDAWHFTADVRGADGTVAASHAHQAVVDLNIVAAHHNDLKNEIEAIETDLVAIKAAITPVTATATATDLLNRIAMIVDQIKNLGGLTNWNDSVGARASVALDNLASTAVNTDIAMGTHKITGLSAGTTNGDSVRYEQVIGQFLELGGGSLSGTLTINPVNNQLILGGIGGGKKVTISSPAPASDRVLTIPIATGNRNFLLSGEAQIVTGDLSAVAGITLGQLAAIGAGNIVVGAVTTGSPTAVAMSGEASLDTSGAVTLANAAVIGKVITGFSSGAGALAATDTIVQAINKLDGNIATGIGATKALDNLASVAINTSLVSDTDVTDDLGSINYRWLNGYIRNVYATIVNAGASGVGGEIAVFPPTASRGSTKLTALDNTGNTVTEITTAPQAGARVYTIPDASASASFVLTEGTQTINGTKTFAGQLIGKGTTTNDAAATGYIGECVESVIAYAGRQSMGGSDVVTDVTSIALTAGDWDVCGALVFLTAGTSTATRVGIAINTASATFPTEGSTSFYRYIALANITEDCLTVPSYRLSLSGNATVYLMGKVTYAGLTPSCWGRITARRVR